VITLTIPPDRCFVLGDNCPLSVDSRPIGLVPVSVLLVRVMH
jgi:hypothetical protein